MAKKRSQIKRVSLSLSPKVVYLVQMLADRDGVKLTTKAADLLEQGLENEDDRVLTELAEERLNEIDSGNLKPLSSQEFWSELSAKLKKR